MDEPINRRLDACDVLPWEYLVELSARYDPDIARQTLPDALAKLAYDLTQSGSEEIRTQQLKEFLHALTANTSTDSTEEMLECIAHHLRCDLKKVRQFARENGIKLKRLKLW
jgi:hypothetical protein